MEGPSEAPEHRDSLWDAPMKFFHNRPNVSWHSFICSVF